MSAVGAPFIAMSILFGALMGLALARNPADRGPALVSAVACSMIGVVAWLVGSEGTTPHVAGVALTLGCPTAALVITTAGRRAGG